MMCCKECLDLLFDYLDGKLDLDTHSSLEEHFQDCPPCVAFLNTYKSTTTVCRDTLNQIEMPDMVQEKLREFLKQQKLEN
ncbi:MAG: zf-HC2 domain-containing protein [Candidatus Nitrohelix vancouverensis]|uniref:Zf-HC2 domain-containing protein n=1 Tax=Candidatus Nitrohelix vancouverensis TaxID=2705534 RepID=A0A7T0G2V9_9BACT|nr:MAG: zf-HC2 domain-containing protein [Candidatus Nitrohelix vancouverensis]